MTHQDLVRWNLRFLDSFWSTEYVVGPTPHNPREFDDLKQLLLNSHLYDVAGLHGIHNDLDFSPVQSFALSHGLNLDGGPNATSLILSHILHVIVFLPQSCHYIGGHDINILFNEDVNVFLDEIFELILASYLTFEQLRLVTQTLGMSSLQQVAARSTSDLQMFVEYVCDEFSACANLPDVLCRVYDLSRNELYLQCETHHLSVSSENHSNLRSNLLRHLVEAQCEVVSNGSTVPSCTMSSSYRNISLLNRIRPANVLLACILSKLHSLLIGLGGGLCRASRRYRYIVSCYIWLLPG